MKPYRVLSLDGGGMRGVYTAALIRNLCREFEKRRNCPSIDFGSGFDLIVGTSTGAILAAALAVGVDLDRIVNLYQEHGPRIFPKKVPSSFSRILVDMASRPKALASGAKALEKALRDQLEEATFNKVYLERGIALAITAVDFRTERARVFKTPHLGGQLDAEMLISDAVLASSAAPIYRSLAKVYLDRKRQDPNHLYVDGGLWANNPVLVGLSEAVRASATKQSIEIFSIGNCAPSTGQNHASDKLDLSYGEWRFGARVVSTSIASQDQAFDDMSRFIGARLTELGQSVTLCRFPRGEVPADYHPILDIDDASSEAMEAQIRLAEDDCRLCLKLCDDLGNQDGQAISRLMRQVPTF